MGTNGDYHLTVGKKERKKERKRHVTKIRVKKEKHEKETEKKELNVTNNIYFTPLDI